MAKQEILGIQYKGNYASVFAQKQISPIGEFSLTFQLTMIIIVGRIEENMNGREGVIMEELWNKYRIRTMEAASVHLEGKQLIDGKGLEASLQTIQSMFRTPDIKTAASLFIKRYNVYIAVLEAMSCRNAETRLSLSQMSFSCSATYIFTYAPMLFTKRSKQSRDAWREQLLQELFQEHLSVMIASLERETGFSASVMWSHIAYYIHVMYERWIREETDPLIQERIIADFAYLRKLPAKWFGARDQNPLCVSFSCMKHPIEDKAVLVRKTCCLNYKTETSKGPCYTCPRLSEQERLEKIQALSKKA
ncbi:hypothetical protein OH784_08975 [Ectobacillus funiculus]|uniref:IucA/IucC family C-terminal-domain containing protein n=1 Tax=Ectobacillus funiculus TaxID=137993 RepID=UPI003978EFCE